ncbi:hypothetical protein [Kribbella sp. C-35]|uniref:hypothetical protein n=1 Tax=Kribbella sp. C-35 TaxID=2789276 RepID=UPI00397AA5D2
MAASQAVALILIVIVAYNIACYWRKLVFLLAVLVISFCGFGIYALAQTLRGEPPTPGDEFVKTETASYQR